MNPPARPVSPIPPGEKLNEELAIRGWSQADLADVLGRPVQAINEIVTGKKAITPETAVGLSRAFGKPAQYWLELESKYRLDLLLYRASGKIADDVERKSRIYSKVPLKELKKLGWIDVDLADLDATERAVCQFLEIDSIDEEPKIQFAARKTEKGAPHSQVQIAWICRVRQLAKNQRVPTYSSARLAKEIINLPKLSMTEETTRTVPLHLAELGIRFVVAKHLTGTRIDGGTVWLNPTSPVVAVSFRYDRMDWFWFTLMHELAHVLAGDGKSKPMLDQALIGRDADSTSISPIEEKADRAAAAWLVPQDRLNAFVRSTKPYFSRTAVLHFAASVGVHPAVVVGQLQRRGDIPYTHHRNLLTNARHLFSNGG